MELPTLTHKHCHYFVQRLHSYTAVQWGLSLEPNVNAQTLVNRFLPWVRCGHGSALRHATPDWRLERQSTLRLHARTYSQAWLAISGRSPRLYGKWRLSCLSLANTYVSVEDTGWASSPRSASIRSPSTTPRPLPVFPIETLWGDCSLGSSTRDGSSPQLATHLATSSETHPTNSTFLLNLKLVWVKVESNECDYFPVYNLKGKTLSCFSIALI